MLWLQCPCNPTYEIKLLSIKWEKALALGNTYITRHFVMFFKIHETFICYLKNSLQCFISLKSNGQLAKTVCFPNKLRIYAPLYAVGIRLKQVFCENA